MVQVIYFFYSRRVKKVLDLPTKFKTSCVDGNYALYEVGNDQP